eukprot:g19508.t1
MQAKASTAASQPSEGTPKAVANGPRLNGNAPPPRVNGAVPAPSQAKPVKQSEPQKAPQAPQPGSGPGATSSARAATGSTASMSSLATSDMGGEGEVRHHPSSSSRAWPTDDGVKEQLITPTEGTLDEYAQFVCALCKLVSRHPVMMRSCTHIFCGCCFGDWVDKTKPNVVCPTCQQAVRQTDVVRLESATGPALSLLHRLYSGMKVRCVYHAEQRNEVNPEVAKARASKLSCPWSGALLDFTVHLGNCQVHAAVSSERSSRTSRGAQSVAAAPAAPQQMTGLFLVTSSYQEQDRPAGTLAVQRGSCVFDFTPVSPQGWVPRMMLTPALFRAHSAFDATSQQAQSSQLQLHVGDVVTVQSLHNGWTYGTKTAGTAHGGQAESGWYPQACISEQPLPLLS